MGNPATLKKGAGPGRPKGSKNKIQSEVKDMILKALHQAGGVTYLAARAKDTPGPFLALVGKVLPLQVTDGDGQPIPGTVVFVVNKVPGADCHD